MNNRALLLIAFIIVVFTIIIALSSKTKYCKFNIEFSLKNGFKVYFQTNETNSNLPKDKR